MPFGVPTRVEVGPDGDMWVVQANGSTITNGRFRKKSSAVSRGRNYAKKRDGKLTVRGESMQVTETADYR